MFLAGILLPDGTIDGTKAALSPRVVPDGRTFAYVLDRGDGRAPEKRITQNDVRAIQLAKAALHAGNRLLMERLGVDRGDRNPLARHFARPHDVQSVIGPTCSTSYRERWC